MKFRNLVIALLVLISSFSAVKVEAQHYCCSQDRYCSHQHHYYDGCYRRNVMFRWFRRGCNFGWRRDFYGYNAKADSFYNNLNAKYHHTYKDADHYDRDGYHRYYHHYNRYYYDRYFDDNFRPQVDDNK